MADHEQVEGMRACNIKFIMFLRFICGFYNDIHRSARIQCLVRIYCVLLPCGIIYCYYIKGKDVIPWTIALMSLEYLIYVLSSQYSKDTYIYNYYRHIPTVDSLIDLQTSRRLNNSLIYHIIGLFVFKITNCGVAFYQFGYSAVFNIPLMIIDIVMYNVAMVGRMPLFMVMSLMYCRVKTMLKTLESNEFDNAPLRRFNSQKYVQMYLNIMESFEETDNIRNFQILTFMVCSLLRITLGIIYVLRALKFSDNAIPLNQVWITFVIIYTFSTFAISAILSDLIAVNFNKMKIIVHDNRMVCENERDRAEIQKLILLMKEVPYDSSVWGVMSLSLRSLLVLLSFIVTTVIAICQIMFAS